MHTYTKMHFTENRGTTRMSHRDKGVLKHTETEIAITYEKHSINKSSLTETENSDPDKLAQTFTEKKS